MEFENSKKNKKKLNENHWTNRADQCNVIVESVCGLFGDNTHLKFFIYYKIGVSFSLLQD